MLSDYLRMHNTDTSYTTRITLLRSQTLSSFHKKNPSVKEGGAYNGFPSSSLTDRHISELSGQCCTTETPCIPPSAITRFGPVSTPDLIPPFSYGTTFTWDPVPNATSYTITSDYVSPDILIVYTQGTTTVDIFSNDYNYTLTLTASNECGSTTDTQFPCFLAGSLITAADGTEKPIEEVCVGDKLLGAFGEINEVLALHRPLLGEATMCKINDEHSTTNHHPHISADRKFYCGDPASVMYKTYGRNHIVIDEKGQVVERMLHGLRSGRVQKLELGVNLKTVEGSRTVTKLETYELPPTTQLYNLVMGGSHTYHVDGYAVTGWPSEEDFDYDAWKAI